MKTLADEIVLAVIIAAVGLASCLDCTAIPAEAQIPARLAAGGAPARDWGDGATILARALLSEADGHAADWRPMLSVYETRAARVHSTPARVALLYASIYRVRPRPLSTAEERALADAMRVAHGRTRGLSEVSRGLYNRVRQLELQAMPGVMPETRRDQWAAASDLVRRWLEGDRTHGCSEAPSHFGDRRGDRARALRMRWREVTCTGSASGFWTDRRAR